MRTQPVHYSKPIIIKQRAVLKKLATQSKLERSIWGVK